MVSEVLPYDRRYAWPAFRRAMAVAGTIAGTTVASATLIDGVWGKRHWPSSPNMLVGIDPAATEASITWSGIGSLDGRNQALAASSLLPGKPAHWDYSTDGILAAEMALLLDEQAPNVETFHTYGHSLGGPVSFTVLSALAQVRATRSSLLLQEGDMNGAEAVRAPKLGRVILNCSPFDREDPRLNKPVKLLRGVKWPVGPLSKLIFSCVRSRLEGKPWDEAWPQAKEDALSGCSPRLWLSQAKLLDHIDLAGSQAEIRPLVGPSTEMWYCRPEDPGRDPAVDTPQASEKYAAWSGELRIPFRDILIPNVGHAESAQTFEYLAGLQPEAALLGHK